MVGKENKIKYEEEVFNWKSKWIVLHGVLLLLHVQLKKSFFLTFYTIKGVMRCDLSLPFNKFSFHFNLSKI